MGEGILIIQFVQMSAAVQPHAGCVNLDRVNVLDVSIVYDVRL